MLKQLGTVTRWRKLRDVALLEVFSGNRGIEVDCGDQAHEAVAPLRSSLDGDVGNCDVIGVNFVLPTDGNLSNQKWRSNTK